MTMKIKYKLQVVDDTRDEIIFEGTCYSKEGIEEELLRKAEKAIVDWAEGIAEEMTENEEADKRAGELDQKDIEEMTVSG